MTTPRPCLRCDARWQTRRTTLRVAACFSACSLCLDCQREKAPSLDQTTALPPIEREERRVRACPPLAIAAAMTVLLASFWRLLWAREHKPALRRRAAVPAHGGASLGGGYGRRRLKMNAMLFAVSRGV